VLRAFREQVGHRGGTVSGKTWWWGVGENVG